MTIAVEAFAKVNLYLHVCDKRPNGYHELDSLIVFAQTGDQLSFEPSDDLSLKLVGPMAPFLEGEGDNLVLQAARGLQKLCSVERGAKITLDKQLPVAAGVGGGSGDAAATLKGLCQLWNVFPDPVGLERLALSLGADVPICMKAHANHVGGVGDEITPLPPLPDCWMVLVNPMKALSTPAVFKARSGSFRKADPMVGDYVGFNPFIAALRARNNDLTEPAISLVPEVADVLEAIEMQKDCALSRMSGSGATCFGLFATEEAANAAQKSLEKERVGWWVRSGKII